MRYYKSLDLSVAYCLAKINYSIIGHVIVAQVKIFDYSFSMLSKQVAELKAMVVRQVYRYKIRTFGTYVYRLDRCLLTQLVI